jgi:hypothetical protein
MVLMLHEPQKIATASTYRHFDTDGPTMLTIPLMANGNEVIPEINPCST